MSQQTNSPQDGSHGIRLAFWNGAVTARREEAPMPDNNLSDHISDPALLAGYAVRRAEQAFLSLPSRSVIDELSPDFVEAENHWEAADEAFADAIPTTLAGCIAKLEALWEMHRAIPLDEDSLELRHVRSLIIALEEMAVSRTR
jgi:hypothetical protein